MVNRRLANCAVGIAALWLLSACSATPATLDSTAPPAPGIPITVSTNVCGSGWRHPSTGLQTFQIHNISANPVDVSLLNAQTGGVYAEIEAVGPGTTRPMQVDVGSGPYAFQCDAAGGAEVTGRSTVVPGNVPTGEAVVPADVADMTTAVASERTYVAAGLAAVERQTSALAADIEAGDLTAARNAWLTAHLSYERLGSAYGMFGDYDDEIDGTPDGLPSGVNNASFSGFYRIEYGLWHGQSAAQLTEPAQQLTHDIDALRTAYPGMVLYPQAALSDLALRTHEILEHTVRFQFSGADDFGSGTTLATAAANVSATRAQLAMLHLMLLTRYPDLPSLHASLDRLQRLIDAEQTSDGWTPVRALTTAQREDIDSAAAQTVQLLAPIAVMFESSPLP
jgi:iron uptake system EfeUOB component EfeO/EfeM